MKYGIIRLDNNKYFAHFDFSGEPLWTSVEAKAAVMPHTLALSHALLLEIDDSKVLKQVTPLSG
jgi:hypothetical protein